MRQDRSVLETALRYPWADGEAGTTLVGGGILTLLSPLVVPALLVLGYDLRVVETVLDGGEEPPVLGDWDALLVGGIKAAVVMIGYVVLPLAAGAVLLAVLANAVGIGLQRGLFSLADAAAAGGILLVLALLLAGLLLVVAYLAPAALVQLARTGRLGPAFAFSDVRELALNDAYGSAWLLSVAVFAANAVVLLVLNAAGVGVILSGFLSFYAFVAMAYLYARGAEEAGFTVDRNSSDRDAADAGAPEGSGPE